MEPKMTLAVYVVNYNYGKYLAECLESLKQQTDQDFELIIIDNGSSDNSLEIIKSIYPNNEVHRLENLSLTKVANYALSVCQSDYIVRLDADDWLAPSYLATMKKKIASTPECAAYFPNYEEVDEQGNTQRIVKRYDFDSDVSLLDIPAHGACTIFNKKVLQLLDGYDESLDRQDGFDIWLKVIKDYRVTNVHDVLFYYRKHGNNLTSNFKKLMETRSKILHKHALRCGYKEEEVTFVIPIRRLNDFYGKLAQEELSGKTILSRLIDKLFRVVEAPKIIISSEDANIIECVELEQRDKVKIHVRSNSKDLYLHYGSIIDQSNKTFESATKFICVLNLEYPLIDSFYIRSAISASYVFDAHSVDSVCTEDGILFNHNGSSLTPIHNNKVVKFERTTVYKKCGGISVIRSDKLSEFDGITTKRNSHIIVDPVSALRVADYSMLNLVKNYV